MDDTDECITCDHIRDEHYPNDDPERGGECAVDGCDCVYFEED